MATMVTGGTGFAGSNIVRALAERGHEVVAYDLAGPNDLLKRYVEPWSDRINFVQGSILDVNGLERLAASFSINKVIHAAAYTALGTVEQADSKRIIETNIMGSVNMLEMARTIGVKRFLYISSRAVQGGKSEGLLNENTLVRPTILYGISKFACERIVERYHEIHDMDTVSIRLGGLYGPMERVTDYNALTSRLFDWTGRAMRGEPIELGPMVYPDIFTYVMDIAFGLCTVLDAPTMPNRLYNLASPISTPIGQLVAAIRQSYPDANFVGPIPKDTESSSMGGMDVSRIKEDLGIEATTDCAAGLKAYSQWRIDNNFTD